MYPFSAALVGFRDEEATALRQALDNLAVEVKGDFPDAEKLVQGGGQTSSAHLVVARVNRVEDLEQVRYLLRALPGRPIVVVLNADSDSSALIMTQRAGAAQTVFYPVQPDDLQLAVDTLALQFGHNVSASKVIAVCGATEGAGATCLAIGLAYEVASVHHRPCILAELSPGLGRLATYLDMEPEISTHELLAADLDLPAVRQALITAAGNLCVLAGPHRAPDNRGLAPARIQKLIGHLRRLAAVVILDLPRGTSDSLLESLTPTDHVLLVGEPTVPSVHDLRVIGDVLLKTGCVASRHTIISRFEATEEEFSPARLKSLLNSESLWTVSSDPTAFKRAVNEGKPLQILAPHSPAATDLAVLARTLLGIADPPRHTSGLLSWLTLRHR